MSEGVVKNLRVTRCINILVELLIEIKPKQWQGQGIRKKVAEQHQQVIEQQREKLQVARTREEEVQGETEVMRIGDLQPEDQQKETGEDLERVEDAEGEVEEEVEQEIR